MAYARDHIRDAARGINALEMSLVNISTARWTSHSGYIDRPTYADTIFPNFAFLAGMSHTPTRRSMGLIGLGLVLQTINAYASGSAVRLPGVLQRLGLATLIADEPSLSMLRRVHGLPLLSLWYLVTLFLGPRENPFAHPSYANADPAMTAQSRIDAYLFGNRVYTPSHDPEGLLGCLTTTLSMLVGQSFLSQRTRYSDTRQSLMAAFMIGAGEALHTLAPRYCPSSKGLWTPSFVLMTSGISIIKYIAMGHLVPLLPECVRYTLACTGRKSLEVYVLSTLLELALMHGGAQSYWMHGLSLTARYTSRRVADLCLSVAFTALMGLAAVFMVRRGIKLSW